MKDSIIIEGKPYITSSRAAEMTKYSKDYIGQLCRAKKIDARLTGRTWYVNEESLLAYKKASDEALEARYQQYSINAAQNLKIPAESKPISISNSIVTTQIPSSSVETQSAQFPIIEEIPVSKGTPPPIEWKYNLEEIAKKDYSAPLKWKIEYESDDRALLPTLSKEAPQQEVHIPKNSYVSVSKDIPAVSRVKTPYSGKGFFKNAQSLAIVTLAITLIGGGSVYAMHPDATWQSIVTLATKATEVIAHIATPQRVAKNPVAPIVVQPPTDSIKETPKVVVAIPRNGPPPTPPQVVVPPITVSESVTYKVVEPIPAPVAPIENSADTAYQKENVAIVTAQSTTTELSMSDAASSLATTSNTAALADRSDGVVVSFFKTLFGKKSSSTSTTSDSDENNVTVVRSNISGQRAKIYPYYPYSLNNSSTTPVAPVAPTVITQNIIQGSTTVVRMIDPSINSRIRNLEGDLSDLRLAMTEFGGSSSFDMNALTDIIGKNISNAFRGVTFGGGTTVVSGGGGSVTSVGASGGSTGLSFSGGPVTSSGTLTLSGILNIANGGIGTSTAPSYGKVLLGNNSGGYDLVATSTLGLGGSGATVSSVDASGGTTGLTFTGGPITSSGTLTLSGTLAVSNGGTGSTTLSGILKGNGTSMVQTAIPGVDYLTGSQLWSTTSSAYFLAQNQGNAFSTTSTDYWKTQNNFFSTTSQNYYNSQFRDWNIVAGALAPTTTIGIISSASSTIGNGTGAGGLTVFGNATTTNLVISGLPSVLLKTTSNGTVVAGNAGDFFSTTSTDYWKTQNNFFSTTSAIYFVDASTTIPKTYSVNTFTNTNTFASNKFNLTGLSDGCLNIASNQILSTGAACGAGTGSGGGTWATTTSQVANQAVNYSNLNTDIVAIGNTSTTTAKFWFDPNTQIGYFSSKLGIGTTSPGTTFSIAGIGNFAQTGSTLLTQLIAPYFTATSTTVASTFPYASTTMVSATTASTTNLVISGLSSALLKTTSNGTVVAGNAGDFFSTTSTDYWKTQNNFYSTTSQNYYNSQFRDWNITAGALTPTTTLGIITSASSTIGNGNQNGGLTIFGGATTTGSAYIAGNLGIGSSTPTAKLTSIGNAVIGLGNISVGTNGFLMGYSDGSGTISSRGQGSLAAGSAANDGDGNGTISSSGIGSFAGGRASGGSITASNSGALAFGESVTNVGGTALLSATEGGSIALGRVVGTGTSASLRATNVGSFAIGYALQNAILSSGFGSFAGGYTGSGGITASGQSSFAFGDNVSATQSLATAFGSGFTNSTASTFQVGYSSTPTLTVNSTSLGVSTTSPWAQLSVNPNGITGPSFVIGSSTKTDFIVTNAGNVGIGTTSPYAPLSVNGQTVALYYTATSTSRASTFPYASTTMITATTASTTNLIVSSAAGSGTRCLQVAADGTVSANSAACATGSSPTTWSTTTSQVSGQAVNYSNNTTDIVAIGNTSTTTAKFWFDPNTSSSRQAFDSSNYFAQSLSSTGGLVMNLTGSTGGLIFNHSQVPSVATQFGTNATTSFLFLGATGGNTTVSGASGFAGSGGGITLTGGVGGSTNGGSISSLATGGAGGAVTITSGAGANASNGATTVNGGAAGSLVLAGGVGGNATSGTTNNGGAGGSLYIYGGNGGSGSSANGSAGNVYLGRDASSNNVGSVYFGTASLYDTSTARLGLGTTSPFAKLSIQATAGGLTPLFAISSSTSGTASSTIFLVNQFGNVGVATSTPFGLFALNPSGITGPSFVIGSSTKTDFVVANSGNVGIATSSPGTLFSIAGIVNFAQTGSTLLTQLIAPYFTATSTTVASTFPYASTTMVSATTASTTNLVISGLPSALLKTTSNGTVVAGNTGDFFSTTSQNYYNSQFRDWNITAGALTPTTTLGIITSASSTIGNGNQNGGLTIFGGATTTGNSYVGGRLSIGTTTPASTVFSNFIVQNAVSAELSLYSSYADANSRNWNLTTNDLEYGDFTIARSNASYGHAGIGGSRTRMLTINQAGNVLTNGNLDVGGGTISTSGGLTLTPGSSSNILLNVSSGNVGIGTSSPYAKLSVVGETVSTYFTATSTIRASTFPYASTTFISASNGIITSASSTLGNGNQNGGLTISGGATTTGNAYFAGSVGIGTNSPGGNLDILASDVATLGSQIRIRNSNTDGTAGTLFVNSTGSGNSGFVGLFNGTNAFGNYKGNIVLAGSVGSDVQIGDVSTGNVLLHAETSNGFIGIGTTSPWGLLSVNPNGVAGPEFVVGSSTKTDFIVTNGGLVGIGTTSPYAKLSVVGQTVSEYFTATSTTRASTFPYASTTAITATTASTTNLVISSAGGTGTRCLQVGADGTVSANASACGSGGGSAYPFGLTGNATSTLTQFNGGLTAYASSTIGNGLGAGGLTISGNSTTTGNAYFAGSVGIGVKAPTVPLDIYQSVNSSANIALKNDNSGSSAEANLFIRNASTLVGFGLTGVNYTGDQVTGSDNANIYTNASNGFSLVVDAAAPIKFAIGQTTEKMRIDSNGNVGIGTTSPYAKLSVVGEVVATNFSATSTTATSTFAGGLNVGSGALKYDFSAGLTSIDNLQIGGATFDSDSGIVTWIDMPVTSSASNNTVESYTAAIDGNAAITVYSQSDGSGGIKNLAVGIGTTTPWRKLSVNGSSDLGTNALAGSFTATSTTATSTFAGFIDVTGTGTNATSTFTSNLWVKGNTRTSGSSYVGDLVFSNNFRFYEEASTSPVQKLFLADQNGNVNFAVDDLGNIGIGTTTPTYKLHVIGDVAAQSFVNISTRNEKKDITYLDDTSKLSILDQIDNLKIAKYRYNNEDASDALHLGLIAEEAPEDVLATGGKGVDVYKLSTFALAGVQELNKKTVKIEDKNTALSSKLDTTSSLLNSFIESASSTLAQLSVSSTTTATSTIPGQLTLLDVADHQKEQDAQISSFESRFAIMQSRIDSLASTTDSLIDTINNAASAASFLASTTEGIASTTASQLATSTSFIQGIASAVQGMITASGNWVVDTFSAKIAYFDRVEAKTVAVKNGVEFTDQATGQIYCVVIRNGNWDKNLGSCGTITTPTNPPVITNPSDTGTTTPPTDTGTTTPSTGGGSGGTNGGDQTGGTGGSTGGATGGGNPTGDTGGGSTSGGSPTDTGVTPPADPIPPAPETTPPAPPVEAPTNP